MKYVKGSYLLITFSRVGSKKKTKVFKNFLTAKAKLEKYLTKHPDCSAVITRVLYNSETINDKWEYKK